MPRYPRDPVEDGSVEAIHWKPHQWDEYDHTKGAKAQPSSSTECPNCGGKLTVRRNRAKGNKFIGCSRFPACRFTKQIEGEHERIKAVAKSVKKAAVRRVPETGLVYF